MNQKTKKITAFEPSAIIAGGHTQTLLPRIGPGQIRTRLERKSLANLHSEHIIPCKHGVRLHGVYHPQPNQLAPLVILIHGWEGSYESTYLASMTYTLYQQGFSTFCLHLRDHGPSHHLNRDVFNSARLDEVIEAVEYITKQFAASNYALCGFSLGGNFAIRVAASAQKTKLDRVFAINPLTNPTLAAQALAESPIYHRYFLKKWKRSLLLKSQLFPDLINAQQVLACDSYYQLCEYFLEQLTPFDSANAYYAKYTISATTLQAIKTNCDIFISKNDPVIPFQPNLIADFKNNVKTLDDKLINLHITNSGGHCGYQENLFGKSWINQAILSLLTTRNSGAD